MIESFDNQLSKILNNPAEYFFILAVSGGLDSMVLLHLFQQTSLNFSVAHCNFKLRGEESDEETKFVENYCKKNQISIDINYFDTEKIAAQNKESIQVTARNLRYNWFDELAQKTPNSCIVTAHHLNDSIETFFVNSLRATGLKGLLGIPSKNGNIIRPLLQFSREKIEEYAVKNNLQWKEDSSNQSTKYLRNAIRHEIIPVLENQSKNIYTNFNHLFQNLEDDQKLKEEFLDQIKQNFLDDSGKIHKISLNLLRENHAIIKLKYLLMPYGFSNQEEIEKMSIAKIGSIWKSKVYKILKTQTHFEIKSNNSEKKVSSTFFVNEKVQFQNNFLIFEPCCHSEIVAKSHEIVIDQSKIKEPLTLRPTEPEDIFIPLGLNKKKKVKTFLKDKKVSLFEREMVWVLVNGDGTIIWVINHQINDKFKITKNTKNKLKISIQ